MPTVRQVVPIIEFEKTWAHDSRTRGGRPMALTDLGNSERLVLAHAQDCVMSKARKGGLHGMDCVSS